MFKGFGCIGVKESINSFWSELPRNRNLFSTCCFNGMGLNAGNEMGLIGMQRWSGTIGMIEHGGLQDCVEEGGEGVLGGNGDVNWK